ncbi:MAG: homoserine dehydrogenase [Pyrinomonadaceae bacterium]
MRKYKLAFLGFGNVGRALARLLLSKSAELQESYAIDWVITGVATRRLGWIQSTGFDVSQLLSGNYEPCNHAEGLSEWLKACTPDILFETTSLNPDSGQPAIDYLRASLQAGAHTVTANKAPIVYAYDELNRMALKNGRKLLFEATVMDSAPVFSLFRETLPAAKVRAFSGIFNSTTNVILETMEAGRTFDEGVKAAQDLGVAETDPSHDVNGWDATMKLCAIARVICGTVLSPASVHREGIRDLTVPILQRARAEGRPYKLVARARVLEKGAIAASVQPEQVSSSDPLSGIRGTSLAVHFELDMIPGLTIVSHRPNLQSTAYGLLADLVAAVKDDPYESP